MKRKATAKWQGTGKDGAGMLSTTSGALNEQPYSTNMRFKNEDGKQGTNPEELIAAAHAGCFNMALAFQLDAAGFSPEQLNTEAVLSLEKVEGGHKIMGIELNLVANVPEIKEDKFQQIAANAKKNCPVSQALSSIDITLKASLSK